jgi:hypothetical protein
MSMRDIDNLNELYRNVITEAKFKQSGKIVLVKNYPMFTLYRDKDIDISELNVYQDKMDNMFKEAKNRIMKLGFPSQHANVVLRNIHGANGLAYPKHRYMAIDFKLFKMELTSTFDDDDYYVIDVIVHEWAHLWMFNKGKSFEKAIKEVYDRIISNNIPTLDNSVHNIINRKYNIIKNKIYSKYMEALPHVTEDNSFQWVQPLIESILIIIGIDIYELTAEDTQLDIDFSRLCGQIEFVITDVKKNLKQFDNFAEDLIDYALEIIETLDLSKYINVNINNMFKHNDPVIDNLRKIIKWWNSYGLTNSDELWATAIEGFFKLPYEHKRTIIKLMLQ